MGTGYTRNDSANNIADGNVINASDLDGEFDAVQAAFNGTTGHSHDGTTGEGPQIAAGGLASNAVTTAKIANSNVTLAKMAANSVDSDQYVDGSIDTIHIANDAVTLGTKTSGNYVAAGATSGTGISGSVSSEGGTFTVTSNATNANTASTIVARDGSGNFSAGTITASLTGTASNANQLDSLDSTQFLRSDAADTKTSGDLSFSDNVKAQFGSGNDLQIYHDGADGRIHNEVTGRLIIRNNVTDQDILLQTDNGGGSLVTYVQCDGSNGQVQLNYYGSTKLNTKTDGVDITGELQADSLDIDGAADITGELNLHNNLSLQDNDKINLGSGNDLQIYHDASHSYISDVGTGHLILMGGNLFLREPGGGNFIGMTDGGTGGTVTLYHNNSPKLATKSDGVDITGELQSDSLDVDGTADISGVLTLHNDLDMQDSDVIRLGTSDDLTIQHNASNSIINHNGSGHLYIKQSTTDADIYIQNDNGSGGETNYIQCDGSAGTVILHYYGSQKLITKTDGVDIIGELQSDSLDVDGAANISGTLTMGGNIDMQDNDLLKIGTGDDLQIYHDGSQSYIINNGSNNLYLRNDVTDKDVYIQTDDGSGGVALYFQADGSSGEARLFHYGTQKLNTTSTGINIDGHINAVDNIYMSNAIFHEGDTDTYMQFHGANQWRVATGGTEMLEINDSYLLLGANSVGNVQTSNVAASISPNMYVYNSFVLTLTGNINLTNPTTEITGMSGVFVFIHSGAGRTVSLGTQYRTVGGAGLTLSGTAGAVDIVPYFVRAGGIIMLGTPQLAFS